MGSSRVTMSIGAQWRHASAEGLENVFDGRMIRASVFRFLTMASAALNLDDAAKEKTLMNVSFTPEFHTMSRRLHL